MKKLAQNKRDEMALEMYEDDEIDLKKYWQIFLRQKWKVLACGVIAGLLAATKLSITPEKYEAFATISFDTGRANVVSIEEVYETGNENWEFLQTQVELIKSRKVIDRVVDQLELAKRPEFNPDLMKEVTVEEFAEESDQESAAEHSPVGASNDAAVLPPVNGAISDGGKASSIREVFDTVEKITITDDLSSFERKATTIGGDDNLEPSENISAPIINEEEIKEDQAKIAGIKDQIAEILEDNLTVEQLPDTQLIKITFSAETADDAEEIANAFANVYIDSLQETESIIQQRANTWLSDKINGLRTTLEDSEKELIAFRQSENLVDMEGVRSLAAKELNEATAHLMEARRAVQQISSTRSQLGESSGDVNALNTLPMFQSSTVIQSIKLAEAQARLKVSELSLRYGPKHPKMIAALGELDAARKRLNSESKQLITGIDGEYQVALANEAAAVRAFEDAKAEYQRVTEKDTRHEELQRQVEINRSIYNTFLTRLKETNQTGGFYADRARLADPAVVPRKPVDKKEKLIIVLAVACGLVIGMLAGIVIEFVYDGVKSAEDVEKALSQNLFGVVPAVSKAGNLRQGLRRYFDNDQYQFTESVRTLRTSLVLYHLESAGRVISVTSSVPEEGKTTVSVNLAFSLAQIENVLLVDCDFRRPAVAKAFDLPTNHPGITDLIADSKSLEECIYHDKQSGLDIMPAGTVPPDAQKVLGSASFANQIKELASKYDRIIIDTPPIRAVSDALLIAKVADSRLYVVKAESTSKRWIRKGLTRFVKSGFEVDGVVINQVHVSTNGDSYGYYADQYGYGASSSVADRSDDAMPEYSAQTDDEVAAAEVNEGESQETSEQDKAKLDAV